MDVYSAGLSTTVLPIGQGAIFQANISKEVQGMTAATIACSLVLAPALIVLHLHGNRNDERPMEYQYLDFPDRFAIIK